MMDFVPPRDAQESVIKTFQDIRGILRNLQIPVLTNMRSVRAIQDGTSAYFADGDKVYRYTKINGKLRKEVVEVPNIPTDTGETTGEAEPIFSSEA